MCDILELNVSCPNIRSGERTGIAIGSNPEDTRSYTRAVKEASDRPLIVKLSPAPYISRKDGIFLDVLDAALEAGADAFSAINTIPGAMRISVDAGKPLLTNRYGGLSGAGVRPIGVGCVYTIYEHLKKRGKEEKVPIIGMGGISLTNPDDALEYFMAGASAVAVGTDLKNCSTKKLKTYLAAWEHYLDKRLEGLGFHSLKDLRGIAHE
jgi:dihydroorotate dehydrogenase (NAD+) catalytic subunit